MTFLWTLCSVGTSMICICSSTSSFRLFTALLAASKKPKHVSLPKTEVAPLLFAKCLYLKKLDVVRAGVLQPCGPRHFKVKDLSLQLTSPLNVLTSTAPFSHSDTKRWHFGRFNHLYFFKSPQGHVFCPEGCRRRLWNEAAAVICNNRWLSAFPLIWAQCRRKIPAAGGRYPLQLCAFTERWWVRLMKLCLWGGKFSPVRFVWVRISSCCTKWAGERWSDETETWTRERKKKLLRCLCSAEQDAAALSFVAVNVSDGSVC